MDTSDLVGSWTNVAAGGIDVQSGSGSIATGRGGSGMHYDFKADGTYEYTALFDIAMANTTIAISEKGAYTR